MYIQARLAVYFVCLVVRSVGSEVPLVNLSRHESAGYKWYLVADFNEVIFGCGYLARTAFPIPLRISRRQHNSAPEFATSESVFIPEIVVIAQSHDARSNARKTMGGIGLMG